mmetsp:Transcript_23228/g.39929  ORF Transcript_23228/g.39929 Transcript_23228/m.39929 type:complete len:182 (-) Transcript_23228:595-1140(-)|eukprot:CAMPEP_0196657710 /NCGR_PEP_ID=MMETSP1086-20130531/25074_1 /TAXON_ID=77921 /ORGANISM="Cyanoptyche  gloeocystis , Strain SAG4.97" /LENGTH=181 /DNA_ID=CAMNT_0041990951 /DNA_START=78 /DNA_END=623 /DNA_ORIENTATION=+
MAAFLPTFAGVPSSTLLRKRLFEYTSKQVDGQRKSSRCSTHAEVQPQTQAGSAQKNSRFFANVASVAAATFLLGSSTFARADEVLIPPAATVVESESPTASVLFENYCAGCHVNGGNIIFYARSKTLAKKALEKNGMDFSAIVNLVTNGQGAMSGYGSKLTESQIADVAQYVLDQAENNWK